MILGTLLLYSSMIYSQRKIEVSVIVNYINKIDSLNSIIAKNVKKINYKTDLIKANVENIEFYDLKHIAALMYEASDLNHFALMDSAYQRNLRIKSENKLFIGINLIGTEIQNEIKNLFSLLILKLRW